MIPIQAKSSDAGLQEASDSEKDRAGAASAAPCTIYWLTAEAHRMMSVVTLLTDPLRAIVSVCDPEVMPAGRITLN